MELTAAYLPGIGQGLPDVGLETTPCPLCRVDLRACDIPPTCGLPGVGAGGFGS